MKLFLTLSQWSNSYLMRLRYGSNSASSEASSASDTKFGNTCMSLSTAARSSGSSSGGQDGATSTRNGSPVTVGNYSESFLSFQPPLTAGSISVLSHITASSPNSTQHTFGPAGTGKCRYECSFYVQAAEFHSVVTWNRLNTYWWNLPAGLTSSAGLLLSRRERGWQNVFNLLFFI